MTPPLHSMKKNKGNTSVIRELDRAASYKQFEASLVTDVSRLLESPDSKDKTSLMKDFGWDQVITRTQALIGNEKDRMTVMEMFADTSVSKKDEIKDIAVTYGLKFLSAPLFKCPEKYELEMAIMITEFMKKRGLEYTQHAKNNFFILADEVYFKKRKVDIDDKIGIFIFYRPPKDDDNFLRVDHIGTGELTFWRYCKGWRKKNEFNAYIHAGMVSFFSTFPFFAFYGIGKAILLSALSATLGIWATRSIAERVGGFFQQTWNKEPKNES